MPAKFIPLLEIDRAIKQNCVIEKTSIKPLTLAKKQGVKNKGVGRTLFIYIANRAGYNAEDVCDFLAIKSDEFEARVRQGNDLFTTGHDLFHRKASGGYYRTTTDTPLFFYRKLILITNYLRYRYDFEI